MVENALWDYKSGERSRWETEAKVQARLKSAEQLDSEGMGAPTA